jgi:hypothetical protein
MPDLNISSVFGHKTVARGVKVEYTLNHFTIAAHEGGNSAALAWNWFITYHYLDDDGIESSTWSKLKDDAGNSIRNSTVFVRKWDKVGRHLVQCVGRNRGTRELVEGQYAQFPQQVEELGAILESQMADARKRKLPNPHAELTAMWKWLYNLRELGKQQAAHLSPSVRADHARRIADLERQAERLKALLEKCSETIWPFHAVYLAKESMEDTPLRVFLTQPRGRTDRVMIVDWTNLDEPKLHGTYEGKFPEWKGRRGAQLIEAGFKAAVEKWQEDNRYWPGGIRYEFKRSVADGEAASVRGMITTGDTTWKEDLAGVLQKIAMGAAVIGLVLTGVGSVYAGAMIVTSMVAGSTASVLSIHHRHSKGQSGFLDDAIDVLDIVANCFGVGYRAGKALQRAAGGAASGTVAWKMGRTLRLKLSDKVLDAMFIGEVWADGFAGILLGVQFAKRYADLMKASAMSPEDRANALLALFAEAAAQGALHGVNNKVTSSAESANWRNLADPNLPHDTLVDAPAFRGHTDDGQQQVTVNNKQQRHPPAGAPAQPKGPPPFPPNDPNVWKKYQITDSKIVLETKDGYHFTADVDHNGYVTIDIQTRVNDKHNPHLGTGRENFDRMFHHFESNGHEIKGWHGLFVQDNYKQIQKVKAKNPTMAADDLVLESITGRYFWKPWAASRNLSIIVEDARDIRGGMFPFSVRFEKAKPRKGSK